MIVGPVVVGAVVVGAEVVGSAVVGSEVVGSEVADTSSMPWPQVAELLRSYDKDRTMSPLSVGCWLALEPGVPQPNSVPCALDAMKAFWLVRTLGRKPDSVGTPEMGVIDVVPQEYRVPSRSRSAVQATSVAATNGENPDSVCAFQKKQKTGACACACACAYAWGMNGKISSARV